MKNLLHGGRVDLVDMMQASTGAKLELPHMRPYRRHRLQRPAAVGCPIGALQVDGRASVFGRQVSSGSRRCLYPSCVHFGALHSVLTMSARTEPAAPRAPAILYAKAGRESKKGEDAAAIVIEKSDAPAAFAIFDGHSGKETAKICSEVVCQRIMKKGPPFEAKTVADTFWDVDEVRGAPAAAGK